MATPTPLRSYRAPCPGCGAPVDFRSAQSTHAVCSFCRSTVVRDGETLARVGRMAELFDDHSALQLLATGRWNGRGFTLVGRLQYRSTSGTWTEWNALFDDGGSGLLAEDNGAYVFALPATLQREVPPAEQFRVGAGTAIGGERFVVASNEATALVSAQGELPKLPPLQAPFPTVELRSAGGEVLSIDYGTQPPTLARGRAVLLDELALAGLRDGSERAVQGRQFACPNCGATVEVQQESSKSITCRACHSLIDLSQGLGGELLHAIQDEPVQPMIPLGSTGQLQGVQWQVVGYQHRMGTEPDDPDEQFGWEEYLLYQPKRGFIFLVDSTEGWSVVKPTTGAPEWREGSNSASYRGTTYKLKYSYEAETTYVAGEFYWPVQRGQKSFNRDFGKGTALLSMEQTPREVTWSAGATIDSDTVAKAFGITDKAALLKRSDASPLSADSAGWNGFGNLGGWVGQLILWVVIILMIRACDDNDDNTGSGYRSGGGSYGGYSSGGGHK